MATSPADTLRAAADKLRPSSPAVAAHTVAVRLHPSVVLAIAKWLESWGGIEIREDAAMPEDARHALAVARAVLGEQHAVA